MPCRRLPTKNEAKLSRKCKAVVSAARAKYRAKIEELKTVSKFAETPVLLPKTEPQDESDYETESHSSTSSRPDSATDPAQKRLRKKKRVGTDMPVLTAATTIQPTQEKPTCCPDYKLKLQMREQHEHPIFGCSFNPYQNGPESTLATVGGPKISVYTYDGENDDMELVQVYWDSDRKENYYSCVWLYDESRDEVLLAVAGLSGVVKIFSLMEDDWVKSILCHTCAINDLAGHPTLPSVFATASKDFTLRLYDALSAQCLAIFVGDLGHTDEVLSVDFDLDGSKMISAGMDHAIKIWDLAGNEEVQTAIKMSKTYNPLTAKRVFRSAIVSVPDFSNREIHDNYVDCVRSFGNLIISKSCEDKMALWRPDPYREMKCGTLHNSLTHIRDYQMRDNTIWFVKFALDSEFQRMACGNMNGVIYVWDMHKDSLLYAKPQFITDPQLTKTVRQVCFTPDGKHICAVTDDSSIWLWSRMTCKQEVEDVVNSTA